MLGWRIFWLFHLWSREMAGPQQPGRANYAGFQAGILELLPPENPFADAGWARASVLELRQVLNQALHASGDAGIPVPQMFEVVDSVVCPHIAVAQVARLPAYLIMPLPEKAERWRFLINSALNRTAARGRFAPIL